MSKENVELVRGFYDAYQSGDTDRALERLDPEFEFVDMPVLPGAGVYRGRQGFLDWVTAFEESFEDYRFEPIELIAEEDRVLAPTRVRAIGRGSGAEVEMTFFALWTVRDGAIVAQRAFSERAEAFAAAGIEP